jgi:hypothetical protein
MAKKYLFELDVNALNASHVVNPQEFFSKALLADRSTAYFRPFLNVNSKIKVGSLEFDDVIQAAGCTFTATDANLNAKAMEPCKLALGVELCQLDLQNSFVAQYMKGSNTIDFANTQGLIPEFMTHYYERLGAKLNDNLERLTWQGDTSLTGATYLKECDGLEVLLADGVTGSTALSGSSAAGAVATVISEITRVYNAIPTQLDKSKVVIFAATNVINAFKVATANASAELFVNRVPSLNFIDVKLVEAKGMSANKMVATLESNLIFMTDIISPASELITINMKTTTGDRKIRTISDFTFGVDFVNGSADGDEIVTYNF